MQFLRSNFIASYISIH